QTDRVAALVAERDDVLVERAALMAEHIAGMKGIGFDSGATARIAARGTEMVQAFQVAALALPVADRIIHELELAYTAKIRNRKNGIEYGLQSRVVPFIREKIHLQETFVGTLLHLDQIRNRDGGLNLRKINSLGGCAVVVLHFLLLRTDQPVK